MSWSLLVVHDNTEPKFDELIILTCEMINIQGWDLIRLSLLTNEWSIMSSQTHYIDVELKNKKSG
jgi:hypothetical protein